MRVVVYIDAEDYQKLKIALVIEGISVSEWFRENARSYVQSRLRGTLTLLPADPPRT
jgi:hypothetical protein